MRAFVGYLFGIAVAFLIIVLCAYSIANAQNSYEVHACFADAVRLCGAKPGDDPGFVERMRIRLCMMVHRDEVSGKCRAVFRMHGW